tara:strand:+ start:740 stop:1249 length:510 start_codon:yes stop_codon:yes gene_type:complete
MAEASLDTFQKICKPTDKKGLFEVFMFNVFYCWTYYNERDLLQPNNKLIDKKVFYMHEKAIEFGINISLTDFSKLYLTRFVDFENEFKLFTKSDFPKTKQFLPGYTFSVFYYEQLKMNPDLTDLSNAQAQNEFSESINGMDKYIELSLFTGDFHRYLNCIIEVLDNPNG